jgi:hypothetical protein
MAGETGPVAESADCHLRHRVPHLLAVSKL